MFLHLLHVFLMESMVQAALPSLEGDLAGHSCNLILEFITGLGSWETVHKFFQGVSGCIRLGWRIGLHFLTSGWRVGNGVCEVEHLVKEPVIIRSVLLLGNFVIELLCELLPRVQKFLISWGCRVVEEHEHPLIQSDGSMGDRGPIT